MAMEGLTIIGETINDSVPSTKKLFDAHDIDGVLQLARMQDERGAGYIDVNIGPRSAEFMAEMVRKIQEVTNKPLSIDTPDVALARAGLEAYDPTLADGAKPILNSISPLRTVMFELATIQPFRPILLISETVQNGQSRACHTVEETVQAARLMVEAARRCIPGIANNDLILDPGIAPIASDSEGNLKRLIGAMRVIHADDDLAGVHASVGLSNFTVMLPPKRADGSNVRSPLESAFLMRAMPLGIDMVIASVKRKYEILATDHPAVLCFEDCLEAEGFDGIMRVRGFYS